ncbi:hypothetical protein ILUMI_11695 [Ignelater luminosus]|uniref:J domain-containing protein n=1 Tax=Ignelater luminosus TaxID=2038154 RepID=A0A8K0G7H7_IGNLU|nr:hypothetical protein ILUMI_11695 [Ignelater luminosus]
MSVDQILNYKRSEDEDYYAILGCDEHSSLEQILAEYKVRALQYHPDKNEGNKEAEEKFQKLQEAKDTLCDPAKKLNYDKWKNSGITISYKQWLGMKEHVHQYITGKENIVADTLSRAPLHSGFQTKEEQRNAHIFKTNIIKYLQVTTQRMESIKEETAKDPALQQLKKYITEGWPQHIDVDSCGILLFNNQFMISPSGQDDVGCFPTKIERYGALPSVKVLLDY